MRTKRLLLVETRPNDIGNLPIWFYAGCATWQLENLLESILSDRSEHKYLQTGVLLKEKNHSMIANKFSRPRLLDPSP